MVVQVGPDGRHIAHDFDAHGAQMLRRAEARELQQLRRSISPARHNDLRSGMGNATPLGGLIFDAGSAAVFDDDFGGLRTGADGQIGAKTGGLDVGFGGAPPPPVGRCGLVVAATLLLGAIEVGIARDAGLFGGGQHGFGQFVALAVVRHVQRTAGAVEFIGPTGLVFGFPEEREDGVPVPALAPALAPFVVVGVVAANIDHAVDRTRAAESAPARQIKLAVGELLLRHALEFPVHFGIDIGARETKRDVNPRIGVRRAGFQQQHAVLAGLCQAGRDSRPSRSRARDDIIECVVHFPRPLPLTSPLERLDAGMATPARLAAKYRRHAKWDRYHGST